MVFIHSHIKQDTLVQRIRYGRICRNIKNWHKEDVDYLLGIVNNRFPEASITIDDQWKQLGLVFDALINSASDYNGWK